MNPHPSQHHHHRHLHRHPPLRPSLTCLLPPYSFLPLQSLPSGESPRPPLSLLLLLPFRKSNVRCSPRSTTSHTLQRNKQIKVRTGDHFFEVMAFAVVMTSGRANKLMVFQFSLSKCLLVQVGQFLWPWCQTLYKGCTLLHLKCREEAVRN